MSGAMGRACGGRTERLRYAFKRIRSVRHLTDLELVRQTDLEESGLDARRYLDLGLRRARRR